MTKTWLAGVVAAVLLLAGGLAGFFIGAANDHDGRDRPGWHQRGDAPGPDFRHGPDGPGPGGPGERGNREDGPAR
jgi:hypothetical protein